MLIHLVIINSHSSVYNMLIDFQISPLIYHCLKKTTAAMTIFIHVV
jgi:hypothetical protein